MTDVGAGGGPGGGPLAGRDGEAGAPRDDDRVAGRQAGAPGQDARPVVLALRALGLGDALTGVPALRGLRRSFPGHRLVLAAPAGVGGWLRDLGVVDDVVASSGLEPVPWGHGPDVAVNLHGSGPESHRLLLGLGPGRLVAFASPEAGVDGPAWRRDEHEVDRWLRLVRSVGAECSREDLRLDVGVARRDDEAPVVLHPGAASGSRRWPVDRWAALAAGLVADGRRVVVTGGPQEAAIAGAVVDGLAGDRATSTAGDLDLPGLARLVAGAALVVCGDTGVAHVATAVGTPSVLLFGPTPPRWWGPCIDEDTHVVLWHGDPERPGDPHGDETDPALLAVSTAEVRDAVEALLARVAPARV
ncbi:glycosyltransferase family 9 protein [Actinotalea sp. AC32]|nr:glycosyltransferase family 9 protein [Actinotalea sp. AC32]